MGNSLFVSVVQLPGNYFLLLAILPDAGWLIPTWENAREFFNFKFYMLLGSLTLILMLVGAIGGPRRAFGRSPGALGAHLTLFDKYVKKCKIWIMSF